MDGYIFDESMYVEEESVPYDIVYEEEEEWLGYRCKNIYEKMEDLEELKNMGRKLDWQSEKERFKLLHQIYELISSYSIDHHLDLRGIFQPEEVDSLLIDSINSHNYGAEDYLPTLFVGFVANTGYKDVPECIDEALSNRRTTAIHAAARHWLPTKNALIRDLFTIYNRYDVNCVDERGLTHLHVACMAGLDDVVRKFLESGHDPNCSMPETGDTPLNVALKHQHKRVAELLLRSGADPNLPNNNGSVPLQMICTSDEDVYLVYLFFEICKERHLSVRVNVKDKTGRSPLHYALARNHKKLAGLLLKNDADPNLTDAEGMTALHTICKNTCDDGLMDLFFKMNEGLHYRAEVDARDNLGRTPLQWAVANLLPNTIDVLIDRGANLSNFVFPSAYLFAERLEPELSEISINFKLRLASGLLAVAERLVKRGYELEDNDILTIMGLFAKFGLFQKSADLEKCWTDDKDFVEKVKELMVTPSISLYDLMQLRPREIKKQLSIMECYKFANAKDYWFLPARSSQACVVHLCENISREFFCRWAAESFMVLIHNRLPILCCEMIVEELNNEDIYNICLAAAGRNS